MWKFSLSLDFISIASLNTNTCVVFVLFLAHNIGYANPPIPKMDVIYYQVLQLLYTMEYFNGSQLAKMKKSIPHMSLV